MDVRFEQTGGVLVVHPGTPRLDAQAAPDFRARVLDRVAGASVVVVALGGVVFMDSSGLAALISVLKRVPPGGQVRLAEPAASVRALLKLTRLDKVFPLFDSLAAALAG
jgi:anti-sigma B factor antagonist